MRDTRSRSARGDVLNHRLDLLVGEEHALAQRPRLGLDVAQRHKPHAQVEVGRLRADAAQRRAFAEDVPRAEATLLDSRPRNAVASRAVSCVELRSQLQGGLWRLEGGPN